ncbi:hypothetical protein TVAG_043900 [Trichomonas vaginalis G3]|uniref:Uncharacterized protein n=1 Tax=Trichomonas vaginalis (strain ATCC PRA-98 / G3) TaxID=412133 RepID=A2E0F0_TRIV3|nr:hypothetical protein TVAGG3_0540970 [Trichomonas vaginalis G3]EAY13830.1 hypothetical protein TVAG_043900 [Trichomonas vaginalis G3]KAI5519836.1 hypothetical protein TVAGG3_0540970 [Trichomonas vaginalis G3]|eukprot:XP_001326053.1 hypothetical protein [Trichomonas vaginalis G3]
MNGISVCATIAAEKLKENDFLDWNVVDSFAEAVIQAEPELGKSLKNLFDQIRAKHDSEIEVTKSIIDNKCESLDLAITKLQIIEEKNYFKDNQESNAIVADNDENNDAEDNKSINSSFYFEDGGIVIEGDLEEEESEAEMFVFDAFQSDTTISKLENSFLSGKNPLTICIGNYIEKLSHGDTKSVKKLKKDLEICKHEINNLRKQNQQYLSLGLDWKKKYREQSAQMKEMMENHYEEIRALYRHLQDPSQINQNNQINNASKKSHRLNY